MHHIFILYNLFLEYSQYYDPTSQIMAGEITSHTNHNEMTSELSTIAPDLTLTAEPVQTISTEPKFEYFDRQMAELEPTVSCIIYCLNSYLNNNKIILIYLFAGP